VIRSAIGDGRAMVKRVLIRGLIVDVGVLENAGLQA